MEGRLLGHDLRRAILVDSTRRGKRMPDALSKTVPIWCAVVNRSVGHGTLWEAVDFPTECVSEQEEAYIKAMIPAFVESFKVVEMSC
jgi:tRNA A64-2'-O-ribosylphosphate transferase